MTSGKTADMRSDPRPTRPVGRSVNDHPTRRRDATLCPRKRTRDQVSRRSLVRRRGLTPSWCRDRKVATDATRCRPRERPNECAGDKAAVIDPGRPQGRPALRTRGLVAAQVRPVPTERWRDDVRASSCIVRKCDGTKAVRALKSCAQVRDGRICSCFLHPFGQPGGEAKTASRSCDVLWRKPKASTCRRVGMSNRKEGQASRKVTGS